MENKKSRRSSNGKKTFNIDTFVKLIKYEFLDHNRLDGRNEAEQVKALRNLEQFQICDLQYIGEYTLDFFKYLGRTSRINDVDLLDTYITKIKGPISEKYGMNGKGILEKKISQ